MTHASYRQIKLYSFLALSVGLFNSCSDSDLAVSEKISASPALPRGTVKSTPNPLVAQYTISPGQNGTVSIEFGASTSYGITTSPQTLVNGSATVLVAGMRQRTPYHMRAVVQTASGKTLRDSDHTFTTGSFPNKVALPSLSASTLAGAPQPGIELVAAALSGASDFLQAYAVDLDGNLIWGYTYPGQTSAIVQPVKLLPNGHMLLIASFASQQQLSAPTPASALVTLREIDLAGNTIRELTLQNLNAKLAASGNSLTLIDFHHDVTPLPNGHFLLLANTLKEYDDLPGFPGAAQVLGDVIVDLDANFNPGWIWNEFDHLDVNRHPIGLPDWTHTNAILYSPDDGNILVSMRHQSWIVKVDYENGEGSGNVLWKLGNEGDFQLLNGTDPADWFFGQHQPSFVSPNSTGIFQLTMMDNGYGRVFSSNVTCGNPGAPPCSFSSAPVLQVDESAKTATLMYQHIQPAAEYSLWGGGSTSLPNGNVEFDLCAEPNYSSIVREITPGTNPTTVWQLNISGANAYRANRIPSLYPGVQW